MSRASLLKTLVAVGGIVFAGSSVQAATITLGDSAPGAWSFTGNGANSVTVSTAGLSGFAFFNNPITDPGIYALGATAFLAGPQSANLFPAGANSQFFSYTGIDGDAFSGTVHWSFIQDNTPQHNVVNTIGFNNSPELTDFSVPLELEPASAANGNKARTGGIAIAYANPNGTGNATVQLTLLRADGTKVNANPISRSIPVNNQILIDVGSMPELAGLLPAGNFIGTLVVHSTDASKPVAAVALEADFGPFSAIPMISGRPY